MEKYLSTLVAAGFAAAVSAQAQTSINYDWAFTGDSSRGGSGYTGSGIFTVDTSTVATDPNDGFQGYAITSVTGIFNGETITGEVGAQSFDQNNNLFGNGAEWFDGPGNPSSDSPDNGLAFETAGEEFAFMGSSSSQTVNTVIYGSLSGNDFGNLSVTVEPVPEPSTLALAGVGIAGLIAARRSKCQASVLTNDTDRHGNQH